MPLARAGADVAFVGDDLVIEGDFVGQRARDIAARIMFQCRRTTAPSLVIDLSGVERIDLTGARALATASKCAASNGVELVLYRPPRAVEDALMRAGVALGLSIRD